MKTRYFTDGYSIWKFPPDGKPQCRETESPDWEESAFCSLEEFNESPGNAREISEEEGEP